MYIVSCLTAYQHSEVNFYIRFKENLKLLNMEEEKGEIIFPGSCLKSWKDCFDE